MKAPVLLALAVAVSISSIAQDSIWLSPAHPHHGEKVTVNFRSAKPAFAHAKTLTGGFFNFDDRNHVVAQDLLYVRSGSQWTATASVADTAYAVSATVIRPDSDVIAASTVAGVDSADGRLFLRSYRALAYAYGPGSQWVGVQEDMDKATENNRRYWDSLTAPAPGLGEKLAYYLRTKKDTAKALDIIANLPLDSTITYDEYDMAASYARGAKNRPLSTLITNVRNLKYPKGYWKRFEYYNRIAAARDTAEMRKILDQYKQTYPEDGRNTGGAALLPFFTTIYRNALAQQGDGPAALALIPKDADGLTIAQTYNNIAWSGGEKNLRIRENLALAKASLDTLEALNATGRGKPKYQTLAEYRKTIAANIGLTADTYAYLLYKTGDYQNAYKYEKISIDNSGPKPDIGIIERYHQAMEKIEKPSKVVASLSTYIAKGQADSAMQAQFIRLYKGDKPADDAYAALEMQAKALKQTEVAKTILNTPATRFTLSDLDGNKISLESLKGKTVVVDFWATWCGPCKASFPAMQKLVDRYKDDKNVAILFVDTWEHVDNKKQNAADFIKNSPYTFHVLLDNTDKVVADYKVDGIPTKFVIDPNGITRFKAVGFNGNTDETVAELDSMIKLAQKQ